MQVLRNCLASLRFTGSGLLGKSQLNHQASSIVGNQTQNFSILASVTQGITGRSLLQPTHEVCQTTIRNKTRNYFPKPSEVKRIRRHSLATRLKTPAGRLIIIKRIIKGRHVLAH